MNILVVEDSPEVGMLLRMMLSREPGVNVSLRSDGFAVTQDDVEWAKIDVVVCDRMLGDYFNGEDLLMWLEHHHPRIRRIMLTGSVSFTEAQAHAHKVLIKPVHPDVLMQAVRDGD